eukprot:Ihof_evm1s933 gene=Ihof_evmTU1s933
MSDDDLFYPVSVRRIVPPTSLTKSTTLRNHSSHSTTTISKNAYVRKAKRARLSLSSSSTARTITKGDFTTTTTSIGTKSSFSCNKVATINNNDNNGKGNEIDISAIIQHENEGMKKGIDANRSLESKNKYEKKTIKDKQVKVMGEEEGERVERVHGDGNIDVFNDVNRSKDRKEKWEEENQNKNGHDVVLCLYDGDEEKDGRSNQFPVGNKINAPFQEECEPYCPLCMVSLKALGDDDMIQQAHWSSCMNKPPPIN